MAKAEGGEVSDRTSSVGRRGRGSVPVVLRSPYSPQGLSMATSLTMSMICRLSHPLALSLALLSPLPVPFSLGCLLYLLSIPFSLTHPSLLPSVAPSSTIFLLCHLLASLPACSIVCSIMCSIMHSIILIVASLALVPLPLIASFSLLHAPLATCFSYSFISPFLYHLLFSPAFIVLYCSVAFTLS